ncbi:MAG: HAD family hydrolase [Treponema sp.]|nr:HAD family hydrolase [Treponema sp.]
MTFDSLILDIDGTLWNTTEVVATAWNAQIKEHFPNLKTVTADILKTQFGKPMNIIADNLFPSLSQEQKDELLKLCCIGEQKELEENKEKLTYPNVVKTIKKLSKKIPVFIVSNCQTGYIELVMKKNKIEKYITDYECFGDTRLGKDENIALVVKRNNLQKPAYVGDTQGDYEACKKAGVPFIWASYGFGKPESEDYFAKISDFSELLKLEP